MQYLFRSTFFEKMPKNVQQQQWLAGADRGTLHHQTRRILQLIIFYNN